MDTSEGTPAAGSGRRVLTVPNAISALRIALIPVFFTLIVHEDTTTAGLIMFGCVVATDWVDGTIARRTGQVSELGKVLDPVADRLAIAAGIIALAIRGVFPVWAAVAIIARDLAVLGVGVFLLARRHVRIEVRWIGKVATFSLMVAVPAISWGALDLPLTAAATAVGWVCFAVGIVEYYIAAGVYWRDAKRALASP
ncbi:MAG TPA: CDP-alcohol phosphatidyltransferase family protein [Actinomycetota bacterium]|jgi:cardiolipin synthase|nr:CDP-alcohol phosphatidyltransferase family protein [Actinomycetota bacterium]